MRLHRVPTLAPRRGKGRKRALAQARFPASTRQQFLDAIYRGQPFRAVLTHLGLTSNRRSASYGAQA
jgi:hypothetical protein